MAKYANINPTALRVSTITACASVSTNVNLSVFFEHVALLQQSDGDASFGAVYVSYCPPTLPSAAATDVEPPSRAMLSRGDLPTSKTQCDKRRRARLIFDNQVTIICRTETGTYLNVKLFKNGRVQLTGAKTPAQGLAAVEYLVEALREIRVPGVVDDVNALCVASYQVCLINSDFKIGLELRRNRLHALLTNMGIRTTFEPCIYPGVKIDFFWNTVVQQNVVGICPCTVECSGRGRGDGNGKCRRVTIAVFESGCIIITGAHTMEQLDAAYNFIVGFIDAHFTEVAF